MNNENTVLLRRGVRYDVASLRQAGWTDGSSASGNMAEWFHSGSYLGWHPADPQRIEPTFTRESVSIAIARAKRK